jgi:hypothetical protein
VDHKEPDSVSQKLPSPQEDQKSNNKVSRAEFLKTLGTLGLATAAAGIGLSGNDIEKRLFRQAVATPAIPHQPFTWTVYKVDPFSPTSLTYGQKNDGNSPISGTADDVIRTVLQDPGPLNDPQGIPSGPGRIYIDRGIYGLTRSFSGFNVRSYTSITLDPQARILVPSAYRGSVFKFESSNAVRNCVGCIIDGGEIAEAQPQQKGWTALLLNGTGSGERTSGVLFNKFTNMSIRSAKFGIQLQAVSDPDPRDRQGLPRPDMQGIWGGWVTGNSFEFIKMWDCEIFVGFNMVNMYRQNTQVTGIHRNRFLNIECQSTDNTHYGVRDIRHIGNSFINVNVWDIPEGGTISNIHPDSRGTIIMSGMMTGPSFIDRGVSTKIMDENIWPVP